MSETPKVPINAAKKFAMSPLKISLLVLAGIVLFALTFATMTGSFAKVDPLAQFTSHANCAILAIPGDDIKIVCDDQVFIGILVNLDTDSPLP